MALDLAAPPYTKYQLVSVAAKALVVFGKLSPIGADGDPTCLFDPSFSLQVKFPELFFLPQTLATHYIPKKGI